ncbi:NAD(+) diphosphatase [Pengzhenrongella sicca]|uniref:NAD(+) diphosphatase n=1 Tax=Pengzhenrongella sicca TaxID=2819238 RepID=UPI001D0C52C0|nr:NAD(+) diphosphatase [Pengzhenrongella sicca]
MDWTDLPLARATVDRAAERRSQPDLVATLLADAATRIVLVHGGLVATTSQGPALTDDLPAHDLPAHDLPAHDRLALDLLTPGDVGPLAPADRWLFLGADAATSYLALVLAAGAAPTLDVEGFPVDPRADVLAHREFSHLRQVGALLGGRDAGLATTAIALAAWHETHLRCPRCGTATDVIQAGWVRRCPADLSEHYPRTDPAVIMAVVDADDRLLLGHSAQWPEHRMSTLAGFVEPGEAIEQSVRREVAEEVGVTIGEVAYRGSQPWPFPASLMLAFRAQALTSTITVDGVEITDARWFTRAELAAAAAAGEVLLPMRASIARVLIEEWFGGALPDA